jgi:cobalt-zinc-cadmium efflux system outer membrane protein
MRAASIAVMIALIAFPVASWADDTAITLKELELEALKSNPEIRMAEKRSEAADEKSTLASAMPDPVIGYMLQNVGALGTSTIGTEQMSMQGVVFTQEIPFPGKLSTKGNVARKQAEQFQENARETRLRVLDNLRKAYYDYFLAYKSAQILEETKELMRNLQRIAETRYSTGQGIQQDVLRAQLEVSMLLDKIAEEEQKKEAGAAQINGLLGRNPLSTLGRPVDIFPTSLGMGLQEMGSMAVSHSPMLEAKQRMVEQSEYELSLSKQEYLPDMSVSVGWFSRGDLKDVWQASLMFKIPLYFWNKSTGVRAANADLSSARYEYEAEKLTTLTRVRDLYSMAKTAEHHLHLYETGIIPQARLALQSATSNYQVGKTDFIALLESESLLLKYQLSEQGELVNLNKTLSMISELTGEEFK